MGIFNGKLAMCVFCNGDFWLDIHSIGKIFECVCFAMAFLVEIHSMCVFSIFDGRFLMVDSFNVFVLSIGNFRWQILSMVDIQWKKLEIHSLCFG